MEIKLKKIKFRTSYIPRIISSLFSIILLYANDADILLLYLSIAHLFISSIWVLLVETESKIILIEELRYFRISLDSITIAIIVYATGLVHSNILPAYIMLIGMASLQTSPRYGLFSIITVLAFHSTSLTLCHHKIIPLMNILSYNNYEINLQLSISSTIVLTITGYSIHKVIHSIFKKLQNAKNQVEKALTNMKTANDTLLSNEKIHNRDLKMAKNVQSAFLLSDPPDSDIYDIAILFKPMSEISGDFYDFYSNNNRLEGIGIFDISGHGISSGLLTIIAKSIIYQSFVKYKKNGLTSIIENANIELIKEIKSDHYLTGIMLHFNEDTIEYLNAAHPTALHKNKKQGKVKSINKAKINGSFLGIDMLKTSFSSHKINLAKGDSLLLFTDCLDETKNPDGKEFGFTGIINAFENAPDNSAEETLDFILKEFYDYTQKENQLNDDLTIILIQKK